MDSILKLKFQENLMLDHHDFFDVFFGQIPHLDEIAASVLQSCTTGEHLIQYDKENGWTGWPQSSRELGLNLLLQRSAACFLYLANAQCVQCVYPSYRQTLITTSTKLDVGFASKASISGKPIATLVNDWSNITIPGKLSINPQDDADILTWHSLLEYVVEIFRTQESRRFVLGFTLCGPIMRVWEFDRLGIITSRPFNIHKSPKIFISVLLGFQYMKEVELGFDPSIIKQEEVKYMEIERDGQLERFHLQHLLLRKRCIMGRATTCWTASLVGGDPGEYFVIKDSWQDPERQEEGLLLEEATKSGVKNIVQYHSHGTVRINNNVDDVRNNIRKGLKGAGINPFIPPSPMPRYAADSSTSDSLSSRGNNWGTPREVSISSVNPFQLSSKSSYSDPLAEGHLHNRVHRRLCMRNIGKSLEHASCLRAILTGLLGGVKGHESLLRTGGILHRDISVGNIMLNEAEDDGFLIDLDQAIKINQIEASRVPKKIGTTVFMSIKVLYGKQHSYMDDLESFFWVLLWVCIRVVGPHAQTKAPLFEDWNHLSTEQLADRKMAIATSWEFQKRMERHVSAYCQPLIPCLHKLRDLLFPDNCPWRDEDIELYSRIQAVLENARAEVTA